MVELFKSVCLWYKARPALLQVKQTSTSHTHRHTGLGALLIVIDFKGVGLVGYVEA